MVDALTLLVLLFPGHQIQGCTQSKDSVTGLAHSWWLLVSKMVKTEHSDKTISSQNRLT